MNRKRGKRGRSKPKEKLLDYNKKDLTSIDAVRRLNGMEIISLSSNWNYK